jgi:hypothetical protein
MSTTFCTDRVEERALPCPFCGAKAEMRQGEGKYRGGWFIECTNGGCAATTDLTFSVKEDAKPLVTEKWNRRVPPLPIEPPRSDEDWNSLADVIYATVCPSAFVKWTWESVRCRDSWKRVRAIIENPPATNPPMTSERLPMGDCPYCHAHYQIAATPATGDAPGDTRRSAGTRELIEEEYEISQRVCALRHPKMGAFIVGGCDQCCADTARLVDARKASHRPLTKIQHGVLTFLRDYVAEHGYAPTFEEIAGRFGYESLATVHEHMETLTRKGWIRRGYNEARAIELIPEEPAPCAGS